MSKANYSFCGWATRNNVRCSDGRTIMHDAFLENDGSTVPLVWNHQHNDPNNVLGHVLLENRPEGVYAYGTFNESESGKQAKLLVEHGDISALSIYANHLKQQGNYVMHGVIREVSLVHAGANPEAFIENVVRHGDEMNDEAIIYTGEDLELSHGDIFHADEDDDDDEETVEDVFNTLSEKQKTVVYALIGEAIEGKSAAHGDIFHADDEDDDDEDETVEDVFNTLSEKQKTVVYALIAQALESKGGSNDMKHNVFENDNTTEEAVLTHADQEEIINMAKNGGYGTFQKALNAWMSENFDEDTLAHGFEDISQLFPDVHKMYTGAPEAIPENKTWVNRWMNKAAKTPFNQIRTRQADISAIRARGYEKKGNKKTNIGDIKLLTRTTTPQTIYIKDELHHDDVDDITDFNIIEYERNIMREALNEEIATAALIGDGRDDEDPQKIHEDRIRPVWTDDELYSIHTLVDLKKAKAQMNGTNTGANFGDDYLYARSIIAAFRRSRNKYKGSGALDCYMAPSLLTTMLLAVDMNGRPIYETTADLAKALNVREIHEIDKFEDLTREVNVSMEVKTYKLLAIFVNANDYCFGSTKGGRIESFDGFNIDFNLHQFLMETRLCGALTRVKSAIVLEEDVTAA